MVVEKPSKVVLDIISDIGGIMGLCIGASLMSFVELFDLAFNCLFIYCGCNSKRVEVKDKEVAQKSESKIKILEERLDKVEGLLSISINKIACLEAEKSATGICT